MNDAPWRLMALTRSQRPNAGEDLSMMRPERAMVRAPARRPVLFARLRAFTDRLAALRRKPPEPARVRPARAPRHMKPNLRF